MSKSDSLNPLRLLKLFGIKHLTRRSDTVTKAIISVINYMLIRLLFRVPISDFQNITFIQQSGFSRLNTRQRSSFANPEKAPIRSYWNGKTIKEVPISFISRAKGEQRGQEPKAIINSVKDILDYGLNGLFWSKEFCQKRSDIQA